MPIPTVNMTISECVQEVRASNTKCYDIKITGEQFIVEEQEEEIFKGTVLYDLKFKIAKASLAEYKTSIYSYICAMTMLLIVYYVSCKVMIE